MHITIYFTHTHTQTHFSPSHSRGSRENFYICEGERNAHTHIYTGIYILVRSASCLGSACMCVCVHTPILTALTKLLNPLLPKLRTKLRRPDMVSVLSLQRPRYAPPITKLLNKLRTKLPTKAYHGFRSEHRLLNYELNYELRANMVSVLSCQWERCTTQIGWRCGRSMVAMPLTWLRSRDL